MSEAFKRKVKGTVMEIDHRLPDLTKSFEPCAPEAWPGARLMDRFYAQIDFDDCGHLEDDDALQARENTLNDLLKEAKRDNGAVYCLTDASLPNSTQHTAVLVALLYRQGERIHQVCHPAGRVTAPDAELFAICSAITLATQQDNCERIYIFTDSIASARRAVDPSVHSGHGHSLAVCRTLAAWLGKDPECSVFFI